MKTQIAQLLFCFLFPAIIFSQTMESGDITARISGLISSMPGAGGDDYMEPTMMQLGAWDAMLAELLAGDYSDAATSATALGYDLIEFFDNPTGETYYVLQTMLAGTNYWGTYVYNPNACRGELIIMSPHPKKDFNTGKQGIYCFQLNDAFFFMLSGTDRCNSPDFSGCSGSTKVCSGSSEAYRITDMAHVTDAIWQQTTAFLHDNVGGTYFVQLHGFTKLGSDPYVIMSNGTRNTPNPDKIVALRDELLVVDNTLTFKIGHIDLSWDRLLGFTNTNGRYINSSANVCNSSAINTNGRFLHIEQEKFKLRNDQTGWHKMAMALGEAFPGGGCPSIAVLPVELSFFEVALKEERALIEWQTLSEINHDYFELQRSSDGHDFNTITSIQGDGDHFAPKDYQWWDTPLQGDNFYRLKQVDLDGRFTFSPVKHIHLDEGQEWKVINHNGVLGITFNKTTSGNIDIYNMLGQQLFSTSFNGDYIEIPDQQRSSGLSLIRLSLGGKQWSWLH